MGRSGARRETCPWSRAGDALVCDCRVCCAQGDSVSKRRARYAYEHTDGPAEESHSANAGTWCCLGLCSCSRVGDGRVRCPRAAHPPRHLKGASRRRRRECRKLRRHGLDPGLSVIVAAAGPHPVDQRPMISAKRPGSGVRSAPQWDAPRGSWEPATLEQVEPQLWEVCASCQRRCAARPFVHSHSRVSSGMVCNRRSTADERRTRRALALPQGVQLASEPPLPAPTADPAHDPRAS